MSKKIFLILLMTALLLSACNTAATEAPSTSPPETTAAPTDPPPTATENPEADSTFTPTPTSIPLEATATPLPPENADDCTNAGRFISDVTIPDNSNVNINEVITKTWRVQNTGTCIWWYGYTVAHYSEFDFGVQEAVPLPLTNPGETADLSVDLGVPGIAGLYRGNFVIQNPDGLPIEIEGDSRLWVIFNAIDDGSPPPATPTTQASESTSEVVSQAAGCTYTVEPNRVQNVLTEINAYRAESGLAAYTLNNLLTQAAQTHAADMACNRFFTHTGSDGSKPETRANAVGYTGAVTENVYGSYPPFTPDEVTDWWRQDQNDPFHNLNLISSEYVEVGIGYAFYQDYGFYVVVFGKP